jgi:hypothetical protein
MTVAQKSPVTLIIAEKPSVAADLVKALGAKKFKKEKTHYASDSTIVSWALGHLVRLADPKEIDDCYKNWNDIDLLPILWYNNACSADDIGRLFFYYPPRAGVFLWRIKCKYQNFYKN